MMTRHGLNTRPVVRSDPVLPSWFRPWFNRRTVPALAILPVAALLCGLAVSGPVRSQTLSDQLREELRSERAAPRPAARPERPAVQGRASRPSQARARNRRPVRAVATRPAGRDTAPAPVAVTALPVPSAPAKPWASDPRVASLRSQLSSLVPASLSATLFEGAPGDILVLVNETPAAPHAARLLSGELRFSGNQASTCAMNPALYGSPLDRFIQDGIRSVQQEITFTGFPVTAKPCGRGEAFDLAILRREELLASETLGFNVLEGLKRRRLGHLTTIAAAAFDAFRDRTEARAAALRQKIVEGSFDGLGTLLVEGGDPAVICVGGTSDREAAGSALAKLRGETVFEETWPGVPSLVFGNADDLFLAAKRHRCGFVLGDGVLLGELLRGLTRDGVGARASSVTLASGQMQAIEAEAASRRANASLEQARQQEERARREAAEREAERNRLDQQRQRLEEQKNQTVEQRRLDDLKRRNDEAARREQLERQHQIVASRAQTIVDTLEARIRAHLASVEEELRATRERAAKGLVLTEDEARQLQASYRRQRLDDWFPDWAAWVADQAGKEWEFGTPALALEDFGTARWKERTIEAIAVRVTLPLLNKAIGERGSACKVFYWINDEEFSFYRAPRVSDCAAYPNEVRDWAVANRFSSAWKLVAR